MEFLAVVVAFLVGAFVTWRYLSNAFYEAREWYVKDITDKYEKDIAEIKSEYSKALAVKTNEFSQKFDAKRQSLENLFKERGETLTNDYNKRITDLEENYAQKSRDAVSQYTITERDLQKRREETKRQLEEQYREKEKQLNEQFREKEEQLKKEYHVIKKYYDLSSKLHAKEKVLNETEENLNKTKKDLTEQKEVLEKQQQLLDLKIKDIPVLSRYFTEISKVKEEIAVMRLMSKNAYKAADTVKNIKGELRDLRNENKNLEYKLLAYESMFPVLKEYEDEPLSTKPDIPAYDDSKGDRTSYWLTPTEYQTLSITERNQRALDRYWNRNKTHSEIGADYEKSIGYWEYEKKGWQVAYFGIDKGLEDMGRDLICISPNKRIIHIVQCKCWSSKKEIHENHINQLFGTTVRFFLEKHNDATIGDFIKALESGNVVPVFYTTTKLSSTAKSFAESLGIRICEETPLKIYPMIKCNINRRTQEKIYHLPFDQQYDNIVIDPPEEFIALTVTEAENAGFRRAFKWFG